MMFRLMQSNPVLETPLVRAWNTHDDDLIVPALKSISKQALWSDREALSSDVLDMLLATSSARVRNASALALVELGIDQKTSRIAEVLKRDGIAKACGTLLFSLNKIKASIPLDTAINLVENGSFEARNEVMCFIEDGRLDEFSDIDFQMAMNRLSQLIKTGDEEAAEAAEYAADCLADYVKEHDEQHDDDLRPAP